MHSWFSVGSSGCFTRPFRGTTEYLPPPPTRFGAVKIRTEPISEPAWAIGSTPPVAGSSFSALSTFFPEKIGLALYTLVSAGALYGGIHRFARILSQIDALADETSLREWSCVALAPFVLLAVTTSKPEIIMTGILLICVAELLRGSSRLDPGFFLAMILNWKFQPLPTLGLFSLAWIIDRRNLKFPLALLAGTVFWFAIPLAVLPNELLEDVHASWTRTLAPFVASSWMNFDNFYSFVVHGAGIPLTYVGSQILSAAFGLLLAAGLAFRPRLRTADGVSLPDDTVYALAFGALFTALFSPLSQNNGYVLLAPMFIVAVRASRTDRTIRGAFLGLLFVLFLAYSDLVPAGFRNGARAIGLKPFALFAFSAYFWGRAISPKRLRRPTAFPAA